MNGPSMGLNFDFSKRDLTCFIFALSVHSLLLLWKGGVFTLENQTAGLGDMLVGVDFRSDIPSYDEAGGSPAPKPKGFVARMKSMINKGRGAGEIPATTPNTAEKTQELFSKTYSDKKGFEGLVVKKDALDVAKGQTQNVVVKPSAGNFEKAEPNLKENKFKLASKDVPFKIVSPKSSNELVNVNAIAVNVGQKTTSNVKSLDGGPGAGPALQSKTFASKGASTSAGFGGLPSGTKSSSAGSGGLSMGSPSGVSSGQGSGSGGGGTAYGSGGTGSGGSGTGSGGSFGSGSGSGGRSYGGGTGFGSGTGMSTLPRNSVPAETMSTGSKSAYNSGFNITGALASRPIMSKSLPPYERDGRVGLRFRVDWSGKVLDGILIEISSGSPTFDQKVVAFLQRWVFNKLPSNRTNEIQEGLITFVFKGV